MKLTAAVLFRAGRVGAMSHSRASRRSALVTCPCQLTVVSSWLLSLLFTQSPADRPTLCCHVYHVMKYESSCR